MRVWRRWRAWATLLKRDAVFVQALYDATNGRPEVFVASWELHGEVRLSRHQAGQVGAPLLRAAGEILRMLPA